MSGLHVEHVRYLVVQPALHRIDLWSTAAEHLVLGTMIHESDGLRALRQYRGGPALGLPEMEYATHLSLWEHSLPGLPTLAAKLKSLLAPADYLTQADQIPTPMALTHNLLYAAAMCRVRYYIVPSRLPPATDPMALAMYWLRHYNAGGKGTLEAALPAFQRAIQHGEIP